MEITVSTSYLSASALSIAQLSIVSSVHDPVKFSLSFFAAKIFFFRLWICPCPVDMALPRSALPSWFQTVARLGIQRDTDDGDRECGAGESDVHTD